MTDLHETYQAQTARWAREREECLARSEPYICGEYVPGSFSVGSRDTHHFDIYAPRRPGYVEWYFRKNPKGMCYPQPYEGEKERAFRIRGEPGNIIVIDDRWDPQRLQPRASSHFPSVESAMAWVTATLLIQR